MDGDALLDEALGHFHAGNLALAETVSSGAADSTG